MAINFGKAGIYKVEYPSRKSPDSLIKWSCKVTLNILAAVLLLPQGLCTLK